MATRRNVVVTTTARAVGGALTLGLGVAIVAGAALVPLPSRSAEVPAQTVSPTPTPASLVCPGSLLQLSNGGGGDATKATGVGTASVTSGTTDAKVQAKAEPMEAPDNASASDATVPQLMTAVQDDPGIVVAGAQSVTVKADDMAGLAATPCLEAAADSWLVGGATTVGRTSFLLLSNPSDVSADVSLTVYSENGLLDAPGAKGITVPPKSQRVFSLAGFAPNANYPVVHVVSTGGFVAATLQHSIIRGLEPGGVELVAPTAAPSPSLVFAGVHIAGTSAIAEKLPADGYADLSAALRVFVPGTEDATVTVHIASESSGTSDGSYSLSAAGGVVSELPLKDLPDGTYSITLESTEPIVASARTSVIASGALDFSWNQAAPALDADTLVPIAAGPSPRIHLANDGGAEATVTLTPASGGNPVKIVVPPGGTQGVAAIPKSVYTATMTEPVSISVGFSDNGQLSAYTVPAPSALAAPLVIYP